MKGCICHFVEWQIHPLISKETMGHERVYLPLCEIADTFFQTLPKETTCFQRHGRSIMVYSEYTPEVRHQD